MIDKQKKYFSKICQTNQKFQQSTFFLLNTITYDFFRVGLTFQKAKRRMEDQLNKIGFGKSKKKESLEDAPGSCKSIDKLRTILFFSTEKFERVLEFVTDFSRRNSMEFGEASRESEFVVLKERRLVPRNAVYDGMLRFSFLLETCQPGSVPDHYLMAAILDLVKNILFLKHIYLDRRFLKKFLKTLKLSILH